MFNRAAHIKLRIALNFTSRPATTEFQSQNQTKKSRPPHKFSKLRHSLSSPSSLNSERPDNSLILQNQVNAAIAAISAFSAHFLNLPVFPELRAQHFRSGVPSLKSPHCSSGPVRTLPLPIETDSNLCQQQRQQDKRHQMLSHGHKCCLLRFIKKYLQRQRLLC